MNKTCFWFVIPFVVLCSNVFAMTQNSDLSREIVVGTEFTAPFSMGSENDWSGLSAELWERIADRCDLDYSVHNSGSLHDLIEDVQTERVDIAIASMTITPEREEVFDFTHSFYSTGLSIAIRSKTESFWNRFAMYVTSFPAARFITGVTILISILLITGFIFSTLERNSPAFHGQSLSKRLFNGMYWSAVTNTTTGYGDISPMTSGGKAFAIVWSYTSVVINGLLIAMIAFVGFEIKETRLISSIEDLSKFNVATVDSSTSSDFLNENNITHTTCATIIECMNNLESGKIDAVIYDRPIIQYDVRNNNRTDVKILPELYMRQSYGFALPENSPYREVINVALLEVIGSEWWEQAKIQTLGE